MNLADLINSIKSLEETLIKNKIGRVGIYLDGGVRKMTSGLTIRIGEIQSMASQLLFDNEGRMKNDLLLELHQNDIKVRYRLDNGKPMLGEGLIHTTRGVILFQI